MIGRDSTKTVPPRGIVGGFANCRLVYGGFQEMGSILCDEHVDERMQELTLALAHDGAPDPAKQRLCDKCGGHRGNGHRWCAACREAAKKEYNADYYRRHYRRKTRHEVSAARRQAVAKRWSVNG